MAERIPRRLQAVVAALDVQPDDQLLEIGCGSGMAVHLVCAQLRTGRITAVDRSAVAIERARRRNVEHVMSGRARLLESDVADLGAPERPVRVAFAVNVNVFWTRAPDAEVAALGPWLGAQGVLELFYDTPDRTRTRRVAETVAAGLSERGFDVAVVPVCGTTLSRISGRPGDASL